jgi:hypothetical protein
MLPARLRRAARSRKDSCALSKRCAEHPEAALPAGTRPGLDDNLDVASQQRQESHQPLRRESGKLPAQEARDLQLHDENMDELRIAAKGHIVTAKFGQ